MKIITPQEQKQIMLDMLEFVDKICRKNNIKYSLLGGSLIGAIRHQGSIPWDDDIDIILTKENYAKLKTILDQETGLYQTLKFGHGGERFSFLKLIDTKTCVIENSQEKFDPNYGIYIDIFCYNYAPNSERARKKYYKKLKLLVSLTARHRLDFKHDSLPKNFLRFGKNTVSKILGYKTIHKIFQKTLNQYQDTDYLISNWPLYGPNKEFQLAKNTEDYIDAKFENLTVMIFKNYDAILRATYGDYMQLPPKSERKPRHDMKMWWGEENE